MGLEEENEMAFRDRVTPQSNGIYVPAFSTMSSFRKKK